MRLRAIGNYALHHEGILVNVKEGDPFEADDPLVREHKWAFAADEDAPAKWRGRGKVESATAAPGEVRDR